MVARGDWTSPARPLVEFNLTEEAMPITIITRTYQCKVCGAVHETEKKAAACEAEPMDVTAFKVGEIVGAQKHGWWNMDTSWTVSQAVPTREDYDKIGNNWEKSPRRPFMPITRAFLPLWKIVAIEPDPSTHRLRFLLWCPRHANRRVESDYGEAIARTYTKWHYLPTRIDPALWPELTENESKRYAELVSKPNWNVPLL